MNRRNVMNDVEINAAIAEVCGWKVKRGTRRGKFDPEGVCLWYEAEHHGGEATWKLVPDYCNDLNAMHKLESLYIEMDEWWSTYLGHIGTQWSRQYVAHAPARQRAEAFLKTIGKWKIRNTK